MQEKWFVSMKKDDFETIGKRFRISPVVARLIRNRDIIGETEVAEYLNGTLADLADPLLFKDSEKAAGILQEKIRHGRKIRIIGDYDIDGINATYILHKGLSTAGAVVDYDIPDRMQDGYGINERLISAAYEAGIDTIVTCDNGIAAMDQVAYAKKLGMTVIITDHHELPFREAHGERIYMTPEADAIINPKQPDCHYPFDGLCGAVVGWRFLEVLYDQLGISKEMLTPFVENAAIATVGDVMQLRGENRIIVKAGLKHIKHTSNIGLKALIEANKLTTDSLTAYHIGFVIGPCMNASGRLDTAKRSLELLYTESPEEAARLAGDLKDLNKSRKSMTIEGTRQAVRQIEDNGMEADDVLVVYLPDCHESLAGIIAGRIRETYHKPTFVLTSGADGVKGSGRSIPAYHMFDEMTKCKELFIKFGGHPMAAGLSMKEENVERLRIRLNELSPLQEEDFMPKVTIDMVMPIDYISEELIDELSLLEPYGTGNPKPLFAEKDIAVLHWKIIGKDHNVLKMRVKNKNGQEMDAIYFGDVTALARTIEANDNVISITYYPGINEYMGRRSLQITIQNYQ